MEKTQELIRDESQSHNRTTKLETKPILNQDDDPQKPKPANFTESIVSIILEPFQCLQMLSSALNPTFVVGIFLFYGLSQGFSGSFFKVVTDFYWKDVQKVQPSAVHWSLLHSVDNQNRFGASSPMCFRTPVRGYKRRPYFVFAGIVGYASALMVALQGKIL